MEFLVHLYFSPFIHYYVILKKLIKFENNNLLKYIFFYILFLWIICLLILWNLYLLLDFLIISNPMIFSVYICHIALKININKTIFKYILSYDFSYLIVYLIEIKSITQFYFYTFRLYSHHFLKSLDNFWNNPIIFYLIFSDLVYLGKQSQKILNQLIN